MVPWAAPSLGMEGARGRTDHVESAYGHLYSSELLLVRRVQRVSVRVLERRSSGVGQRPLLEFGEDRLAYELVDEICHRLWANRA